MIPYKTKSRNLILGICILNLLFTGCGQKTRVESIEQAQRFVSQSENYYQRAISSYKDLLVKSKDPSSLYFELGQVFYNRGDFIQAAENFKNSNLEAAKNFLAISYYKSGNFIDALEIFDKVTNPDDESRYYHGVTCEKLNLYDPALDAYQKITQAPFIEQAKERINIIEKQVNGANIKDLAPEVNKIIQSAPSQESYPQAGALILSSNEEIEISASNTLLADMYYLIKILNERGKKDFSEIQIEYDSTYEKVELDFARTIKPDGVVVDVGSRHIRDVSKYLNFPLYSNARVYIISFPEIVEGAVIEYKVKVSRNQLINKNDFVSAYSVQDKEPVISANFSLKLPEERSLHFKTLNEKYNNFGADLKPKIEKKEGFTIYSWQFNKVPQIVPESNMPPVAQINPAILFSTFSSWDEIYNWWRGLAEDKIKADEAIKEKVKELTLELNSDEEKIRAIYNFCAQKIRYVAVEYGQAGYEPHKAEDIFRNKYGDCKDQAILLVTMLREAGLQAFPVLIPTREIYNLNPDFPSMMFNHAIAAVKAVSDDAEFIFVDPTAETCAFGDLPGSDQNRLVLVVEDDKYSIKNTPLYTAQHNSAKQELKIKINNEEGITAQKNIATLGIYDQAQRYWLLYTPPQLIEETLNERIQTISIAAKLLNYNIENLNDLNKPISLNYEFKGEEYLVNAGDLRIIPQLADVDTRVVAKDSRRFPLDFEVLDSKETVFDIELPDNLTVQYIPENVNEDSPWLSFTVVYLHKDNIINFRQKIELKQDIVSQEEYFKFKNFYETLAKKVKQRIVLEKKK